MVVAIDFVIQSQQIVVGAVVWQKQINTLGETNRAAEERIGFL